MKIIYFTILLLFLGCSREERDNVIIQINEDYILKHPIRPEKKLNSTIDGKDLFMFYLSPDFLPSGWSYEGEISYYEMERLKYKDGEFLIYSMRADDEIVNVRIATFQDNTLRYNWPVWHKSPNNGDYTLITKTDGKYIAEIFQNSIIMIKYHMENGEVDILRKDKIPRE